MVVPPSFTDSITAIAQELRDGPLLHAYLIRAVSQIDHLGRRLHGLGYVRHREIAACLMAAVAELQLSIGLPEAARGAPAERAAGQLEAALVHIAEGAGA